MLQGTFKCGINKLLDGESSWMLYIVEVRLQISTYSDAVCKGLNFYKLDVCWCTYKFAGLLLQTINQWIIYKLISTGHAMQWAVPEPLFPLLPLP